MAHCFEVVGWNTNDKFTEAQPVVIVSKWFSSGTTGKADISDRWPTVTPQLANVGPTIVCYMGSEQRIYFEIALFDIFLKKIYSFLRGWGNSREVYFELMVLTGRNIFLMPFILSLLSITSFNLLIIRFMLLAISFSVICFTHWNIMPSLIDNFDPNDPNIYP